MSSAEKPETSPPLRKSDEVKKNTDSVDDDVKPDEAKGGMGPYFVSTQILGSL